MMRCIKRLYVMPILVEHLQETGVGRSVNALRKYSGEVGDAAKALVAKWKAMVAAQEEEEEAAAAAAVRRSDEEAEEAESEDEVSETKNNHRHYEKKVGSTNNSEAPAI
ncbi:hypothetical protein AAG570_002666 [Ranatra chinensis]|uniref:TFIIS N-terminal domain-containing protein n=1 Tax=Ranatra chinensis TaxID=642074 RepID=A0ABD0Y887_9HEMI